MTGLLSCVAGKPRAASTGSAGCARVGGSATVEGAEVVVVGMIGLRTAKG